jgi:hypothetical protein
MALCDPESTPFGACTPNSDSNTSGAGSAILQLQFYPPGSSCPRDDSKWCAALNIFELTTNCGEPGTAAPITTDGTPGGTSLLMSPSDSVRITVKDTADGLETDVEDLTSATMGSMVASGANRFMQTVESNHANDPSATCPTVPFNYHPEYLTASTANNGSWINANINFSFEIGHGELCGDAACTITPNSNDTDDTGCGNTLGVGICTGPDNDHDGNSYIADWPGGTANHPASLIIGNVLDDGMGPLSFSGGSYQAAYGKIFFQKANVAGAFYPFFSQAGTGQSCVFNFGNDIPLTTTNDFGQAAQYGTTISNPCPGSKSIIVYVGYLNNLTGSPNPADIPTPFDPDATTTLISSGGVDTRHDTGVIRFENRTDGSVTIDRGLNTTTGQGFFQIWDKSLPIVLAPGQNLVLAETENFNFDTSNFGLGSDPVVGLSVNGNAFKFTDSRRVLLGHEDAIDTPETTAYQEVGRIAP